ARIRSWLRLHTLRSLDPAPNDPPRSRTVSAGERASATLSSSLPGARSIPHALEHVVHHGRQHVVYHHAAGERDRTGCKDPATAGVVEVDDVCGDAFGVEMFESGAHRVGSAG